MAHYAFLDENNIVTEVITGKDETELIDGLSPEEWYGKSRNLEQADQIPATAYPSARPESFDMDANVVPVVMPDGSVANVKIPAGSISEDLFR